MRGKSKEFNKYLQDARKGDPKALEYFYDNYYYYIIDATKFWKDEETKGLVVNYFENRLKESIKGYFDKNLGSHLANYIEHALMRSEEAFKDKIDAYVILIRNFKDKKELLMPKLMDEINKKVSKGLKEKEFDDNTKYKFLYICYTEAEKALMDDNSRFLSSKIDKMIEKATTKEIASLYLRLVDLNSISDIEKAYSHFIGIYVEKYKGMLDKETVHDMYEEKFNHLLDRLDTKKSNPNYLSNYFGSNFNSYSFSVKGYERRLIANCNKKICKLLRDYEKTLSKEDLKMLRSIYYPITFEYVKQPKTEDFETFFIKHLINYDLEEAKELRKTYNKYKDEYEIRNVLIK